VYSEGSSLRIAEDSQSDLPDKENLKSEEIMTSASEFFTEEI